MGVSLCGFIAACGLRVRSECALRRGMKAPAYTDTVPPGLGWGWDDWKLPKQGPHTGQSSGVRFSGFLVVPILPQA